MIFSGKLRHKISIEQRTTAPDEYGQTVETWSKIGERYAAILPIVATEQAASGRFGATLTHQIMMRHFAGIDPQMRLKFGNRIFNIVDIKEDPTLVRDVLLKVAEVLP